MMVKKLVLCAFALAVSIPGIMQADISAGNYKTWTDEVNAAIKKAGSLTDAQKAAQKNNLENSLIKLERGVADNKTPKRTKAVARLRRRFDAAFAPVYGPAAPTRMPAPIAPAAPTVIPAPPAIPAAAPAAPAMPAAPAVKPPVAKPAAEETIEVIVTKQGSNQQSKFPQVAKNTKVTDFLKQPGVLFVYNPATERATFKGASSFGNQTLGDIAEGAKSITFVIKAKPEPMPVPAPAKPAAPAAAKPAAAPVAPTPQISQTTSEKNFNDILKQLETEKFNILLQKQVNTTKLMADLNETSQDYLDELNVLKDNADYSRPGLANLASIKAKIDKVNREHGYWKNLITTANTIGFRFANNQEITNELLEEYLHYLTINKDYQHNLINNNDMNEIKILNSNLVFYRSSKAVEDASWWTTPKEASDKVGAGLISRIVSALKGPNSSTSSAPKAPAAQPAAEESDEEESDEEALLSEDPSPQYN